MSTDGCVVVVGGTAGIGKEFARYYAATGRETILTGRDAGRAEAVADRDRRHCARHRPRPRQPADPRRPAIGRDRPVPPIVADPARRQHVRDFDIDRALELVTLKLVGFAEVVHVLLDRLAPGQLDRAVRRSGEGPAVPGLDDGVDRQRRHRRAGADARLGARPIRVNAIHPGIVGDSPYWPASRRPSSKATDQDHHGQARDDGRHRRCGRVLLENPSADGIDLAVDNGRLMF